MDDETRLGGWVPATRTLIHDVDETLFTPKVPTQPQAPAQPRFDDLLFAGTVFDGSNHVADRTSDRELASPRRLASTRSVTPGPASAPFGLNRLPAVLRFAHPANWHPPARRGSGPVRTMRLLLARHRRLLSACLALAGLWITIRAAAPPPPPTVPVLVATHDLPAGRTLTSEDLRPGRWPADGAPRGHLTAATGRTLASAIRAGELVTDARVVGPGLLAGQAADTVAVPVRLGDPAAGTLVRAGDRVDVLAASSASASSSAWSAEPDLADGTEPDSDDGSVGPTSSGNRSSGAERVAARALVLAVPGASSVEDGGGATGSAGSGLSGLAGGALPGAATGESSAAGLLVLAVSSSEAARLTALQSDSYLGIAVLAQD